MSSWRITSEGASWVSRTSCAGWSVVAGAGTDMVGVVMANEVVHFEVASFRAMTGVSCMGAESLGRLQGRKEPSVKGVPNLPCREAVFLVNAER